MGLVDWDPEGSRESFCSPLTVLGVNVCVRRKKSHLFGRRSRDNGEETNESLCRERERERDPRGFVKRGSTLSPKLSINCVSTALMRAPHVQGACSQRQSAYKEM